MSMAFGETLWCAVTMAVYAGGYWGTLHIVDGALSPYSAVITPLADYIMYAGLLGTVVTGIVADKFSARAAVNLSMLSSAAIYACVYLLLAGVVPTELREPLAIAVRVLTALQHGNQAVTTYICIVCEGIMTDPLTAFVNGDDDKINDGLRDGLLLSRHTAALVGVVRGAVAYTLGNIAAVRFLGLIGSELDIVAAVAVAHVCTVVASLALLWSASPRTAEDATAPRPSLLDTAIGIVPHVVFVVAARCLCITVLADAPWLVVPQTAKLLDERASDLVGAVSAESALTLGAYLFVLAPLIVVVGRGPTSVLAFSVAVLALARVWLTWSSEAAQELSTPSTPGCFQIVAYVAATVGRAILTLLPTAVIGIGARHGTKGRMIAAQAVITTLVLYERTAVVEDYLRRGVALLLPAHEDNSMPSYAVTSIAFVSCAVVALLFLYAASQPIVAGAAPSAAFFARWLLVWCGVALTVFSEDATKAIVNRRLQPFGEASDALLPEGVQTGMIALLTIAIAFSGPGRVRNAAILLALEALIVLACVLLLGFHADGTMALTPEQISSVGTVGGVAAGVGALSATPALVAVFFDGGDDALRLSNTHLLAVGGLAVIAGHQLGVQGLRTLGGEARIVSVALGARALAAVALWVGLA